MTKPVDITGQRFGKLLAISRAERKSNVTMWLCRCDCGVEKPVYLTLLKNGEAKSCGCSRTPRIPYDVRIRDSCLINAETGCWNWHGNKDAGGYGRASVSQGSRAKKLSISSHRMSWIAFNGEIPYGMHVLHRCDNRACCNPDHLFLGTHQDNMRDMHAKGRGPRGYKRDPAICAENANGRNASR